MIIAAAAQKAKAPAPLPDRTAAVFIAIILIVVLARLLGRAFKAIGQPPVIGEILAGILLGASVLGQFHDGHRTLTQVLFPADVTQILRAFANLGIVFFMFIVGMELDQKLIKGNERKAGVISLSSIIVPLAGGVLLGLALYGDHSTVGGSHVKKLAFVLFVGASMCVTAFPVLARILNERGMARTPLGTIALACAAIDDVVAWSLLAAVSAIGGYTKDPFWQVLLYSVIYLIVMFWVVRPLLARYVLPLYKKAGRLTPELLAGLVVLLVLSAWFTDHIGIHFFFGAFIFGLVLPRQGTEQLFHEILERLEQVSVIVFLPIFFIITGLTVDLTTLTGKVLGELFAVLAVAIGGKFIGAYFAARSQGIPNRRSQALGLLMNTRGLTELILLQVGVKLKVLDVPLFTMLVVMAIVTTFMTSPLLKIVYPDRLVAKEVEEAERAALGVPSAFRVLVVLEDAEKDAPLATMAADIAGSESPSQVVLSIFQPQATDTLEVGIGLGVELAEMAAVMSELEGLAEQVRARGIDCVVLSRFSADPTADAASQIKVVDANLVVLSPTAAIDRERLMASVDVTIADLDGVIALASVPGPVVALAHGGDGSDSAIAIAVRMAAVRHTTLMLVDDGSRRRLSGLVERLGRFGVHAEVVGQDQVAEGLLLLDYELPRPEEVATAVRVRPNRLKDQSELGKLLEDGILVPSQPSPTGATETIPTTN